MHMLVAERAPLPRLAEARCRPSVSVVCQVLKNARPTVDVAALGYARRDHLRQTLHANGAQNVARVDHVVDNLDDIPPLHIFVGIVELQRKVLLTLLDNELEGRKDAVVLGWPVVAGGLLASRVVSWTLALLLIAIAEAQKEVGILRGCAPQGDLLLHRLHRLYLRDVSVL